MASRTERDRILIGGMQGNDPGDKQPPGNSLIIENFRPDTGDQLISRVGCLKGAGPVGSGTFHTLRNSDSFGGILAGIGKSLYGPDLGLSITVDTGYDGEPLGVAYSQGSAWIMNRARQSRILGDRSRERWGVPAPVTAPTATGGGQLSTLIGEFDALTSLSVGVDSPPNGSDPFTDYALKAGVPVVNPSVTADIDTANYRSGTGSLRMVASVPTSVTAFMALDGADLRVDGLAKDEDVVRVWVFASNPASVDRVTVYLRSGDRTDPDHGFVEYSFDAAKFLNQSLNSWTQLKLRRRLNLDDWSQRIAQAALTGDQQTVSDIEAQFTTAIQTPTFIYSGSGWPQTGIGGPPPATYPPSKETLNLNWAEISEFGVTFKLNAGVQVGVDRAEVVGTVGADSSGAIQYFISFENEDEQDGNPSPASNSVITGNQTITLTGIAVSPDSNTRARRIYRIGGGLSQPYLIGRLWGNASTGPFTDTMSNAQAQADNIVMPGDHNLPPRARGVIGPFYGKLVAFASDAHPARYWWTPSARPWFFPGSDDDLEGNWEDCGGDEERLLTATDHKQTLILYKQKSIWRISGDPQTTDPVKTNALVGAVGPKAVVSAGAFDYFIGSEGIYRFNGDFEEKISGALDPIFKGHFVNIESGYLVPVNRDALAEACISLVGDRLRVSYPEVGSSVPNVILICHLPTGRWMREKYDNLAQPAFTCMHFGGGNDLMLAGATGGYLYGLETQGRIDDGNPIHLLWHSQFHDQGLPDSNKVYTEVEIDFETGSLGGQPLGTLSVDLVVDNGVRISLGTITSTDPLLPRLTSSLRVMSVNGIDIGRTAKNAAIRIEGTTVGQVTIFGIYLHWYAEQRVARTFDTGSTNCGIPERVKEVDHIEFYMTASGQQISKSIQSDLPGGILARRDQNQLTAPNGRGTLRMRLGVPIDGRNFRMWLGDNVSGATFQVHQARARMRVIGEYIDGMIGEYYESPEFSIAPGRVGELKDILLDYDCTGGDASLQIYSDLPGNQMGIVLFQVLPAQTRAPRVVSFELPYSVQTPGNTTLTLPYGQMFKIRIYPPPGGIVRLHGRARIRVRVIGCYFDGSRGEVWETQPLDLLGGMGLFREISLVTENAGPMFLDFRTELPGNTMATVASFTIPASTGRVPFIGRLPGSTKGRLQQARLVGGYVTKLFEAKVLARRVQTNDTPWDWIPLPVEPTPDTWAEVNMPVRSTPEEFQWVEIPVDEIA